MGRHKDTVVSLLDKGAVVCVDTLKCTVKMRCSSEITDILLAYINK